MDILFGDDFYMGTLSACIADLSPPTFAGISFLDVESRGQIRAGWSAATDPTPPIRYEVYIQPTTSVGLFSTANITAITPNLQVDIFTMPDGSFLVNGTTYYVGVRALDGVSNRDANLVSMSVISTGILTSIDVYEASGAWSTDSGNQFQVTAWATKNSSRAKAPNEVMGAASYQIFDSAGIAIGGLSGSVGSPNAEGLYVFSAVVATPPTIHNHCQIRITVSVDGEDRTNFLRINEDPHVYSMDGTADILPTGELVGSFWVRSVTGVITTNLGTGSWDLYTADGTYTGIGGTGLTANADGFFIVPPFTFPGPLDETQDFIVKAQATVAGESINTFIVLEGDPRTYDPRAIFSINGANQLQATFWAVRSEQQAPASILGTASYTVYDSAGVAVSGLTQTGITADGNGYYHITPVSAALLTDLTHYKVKVTMELQGQERTSTHGFTLLGN